MAQADRGPYNFGVPSRLTKIHFPVGKAVLVLASDVTSFNTTGNVPAGAALVSNGVNIPNLQAPGHTFRVSSPFTLTDRMLAQKWFSVGDDWTSQSTSHPAYSPLLITRERYQVTYVPLSKIRANAAGVRTIQIEHPAINDTPMYKVICIIWDTNALVYSDPSNYLGTMYGVSYYNETAAIADRPPTENVWSRTVYEDEATAQADLVAHGQDPTWFTYYTIWPTRVWLSSASSNLWMGVYTKSATPGYGGYVNGPLRFTKMTNGGTVFDWYNPPLSIYPVGFTGPAWYAGPGQFYNSFNNGPGNYIETVTIAGPKATIPWLLTETR
jgi:hypothetical protein